MPESSTPNPSISRSENTEPGVAAVDRAFAIVSAVANATTPISLSELARTTGLYKSTVLRLLASLEKSAIVVQRFDLKYEIGPFAFLLGRAYEVGHSLKDRVVETLNQMIAQGTESASFHVPYDDEQRLCLFRIDSRHPTLDNIRAGDLLPLHLGAPGKIIEIFYPHSGSAPPQNGPLSLTTFGERDPSCAAIASPVFGPAGQFLGALSLSGARERYSNEAIVRMRPILLASAEALTRSLGGRWPILKSPS